MKSFFLLSPSFVAAHGALFPLDITHPALNMSRREAKSNTQLSAATALLDLTCDAVVALNGDLRMASHSSKLAAVLLRNRPGATLEGTKFTDLVAPADCERVTELLRRDSGGRTYATAFRMQLVDSCASKFQTEVFQVKYTTAGGEKHHIIGLRQDGAQVKFACVWMCLVVWLILFVVIQATQHPLQSPQ